jgi:triosephosphate isomerase
MTPGIRPLVAGNWKMNGTSASLPELRSIANGFMKGLDTETEGLVCVPATLLTRAAEILSSTPVKAGGQDCHAKESGAHTGDISAEMLKDAGARYVIVGHSDAAPTMPRATKPCTRRPRLHGGPVSSPSSVSARRAASVKAGRRSPC